MFTQTANGELRVDELRKQFSEFKLGQLAAQALVSYD